jgi:phosphoribosyl 1,2-cyclic phosphodiesterase
MTTRPAAPVEPPPRLRVLASGSAGNCTVIIAGRGMDRSVVLVDIGISLRRARLLLRDCDLDLADIDAVLVTHLDSDHYQPSWTRALSRATFHMHDRHHRFARRHHLIDPKARVAPHDGERFLVTDAVSIDPLHVAHDDLGVSAFRFAFRRAAPLGFATDIGRVTDDFIAHFRGVATMAIESNYCPRLQLASSRPEFLKRRIMGGSGHLSNEQCADALEHINPTHDAVLLHLSRECNTPGRARAPHAGRHYRTTVTSQHDPTPWIEIPPGNGGPFPASLFETRASGRA